MEKKVFGLDIRSLGAFRIIIGLVLLYDLIFNRIVYYKQLYSYEEGLMNSFFFNTEIYKDSFWSFIQTGAEMPYIFVLALISYLCYVLGYLFKINRILTPILFVYISHKYFLTLIGADQIITVLLLFTIFLPIGQSFAFISKKNSFRNYEIRGVAVWALLIQISIIYFFNAINKTGDLWLSGNVVKVATSDTILSTRFSYLLAKNNLLNHFTTYFSYAYEFLFPLLLFFPYRNQKIRLLLSFIIIFFHFSISIFMDVGHFYLVFLSISILLLPTKFWNYFTNKSQNKNSIVLRKKNTTILRITVIILLFLAIQRNVFSFLNRLTFSDTKIYQTIYSPFEYLNELPISTPFLSQSWVFFTPNPPEEMGILTIEGIDYENGIINLSNLDPFKKRNNYKTESSQSLRLLGLRIRYYLDKWNSNKEYTNNAKVIELKKLWSNYNINQIKKKCNLKKFDRIEVVLYSCKSKDFLINDTLSFNKIKLFSLYEQ